MFLEQTVGLFPMPVTMRARNNPQIEQEAETRMTNITGFPGRSADPTAEGASDSSGVVHDRPFGVHVRMARWKSLLVIFAVPVLLLVVQILVFQVVVLIEGPADPQMPALTPLTILATGISTAITALLAIMLMARLAKMSWRSIFRHDRSFDWRRVGLYLAVSAALVTLTLLIGALVAPDALGWGTIEIGTTTLVIIVITLVAIPLQSAGEEIAFRGVIAPAAGSWFRNVRLAAVFAIVVSAATFALVHVSVDPWFVGYLFVFSASTVALGLISGGLEAAMAFHVSNNVVAGIFNALLAGNEPTTVDRQTDSGGGPTYLILMAMNVVVVAAVWAIERRNRRARGA